MSRTRHFLCQGCKKNICHKRRAGMGRLTMVCPVCGKHSFWLEISGLDATELIKRMDDIPA